MYYNVGDVWGGSRDTALPARLQRRFSGTVLYCTKKGAFCVYQQVAATFKNDPISLHQNTSFFSLKATPNAPNTYRKKS